MTEEQIKLAEMIAYLRSLSLTGALAEGVEAVIAINNVGRIASVAEAFKLSANRLSPYDPRYSRSRGGSQANPPKPWP